MKKKNIRIIAVAFIGILFVGVIGSMSYIRNLPVDYDAGACGGGYATFIFDKYSEELIENYCDGMADNSKAIHNSFWFQRSTHPAASLQENGNALCLSIEEK